MLSTIIAFLICDNLNNATCVCMYVCVYIYIYIYIHIYIYIYIYISIIYSYKLSFTRNASSLVPRDVRCFDFVVLAHHRYICREIRRRIRNLLFRYARYRQTISINISNRRTSVLYFSSREHICRNDVIWESFAFVASLSNYFCYLFPQID